MTWGVWLTEDPSLVTEPAEDKGRHATERTARRAAAEALGRANLRGLARVPCERGVRFYSPGADDYQGASVEIGRTA